MYEIRIYLIDTYDETIKKSFFIPNQAWENISTCLISTFGVLGFYLPVTLGRTKAKTIIRIGGISIISY